MTDDPDLDAAARVEVVPEGIAVRIWFGVKQVCRSANLSFMYLHAFSFAWPYFSRNCYMLY